MKILPICTTQYQKRQPAFGGNTKIVFDNNRNVLYRANTCFLRPDFDWWMLDKFLEYQYPKQKKVNIIDHACSSGEEAYTIVMNLIDKLGEKAKKYFPIIAKDYDEENITTAKNYKIPIDKNEEFSLAMLLKNVYNYGNFVDNNFIPNDVLRNNIQFSTGDILKDIDTMPTHNTVLFCRNFWPYLKDNDRDLLMSKIAARFDDTCCVAIGDYDFENADIDNLFNKYGFEETFLMHMYKKVK